MIFGGDKTPPASEAREAALDPFVGRTLGDFVLRARLGQGGFGTVYRAEQPLLAREAVVKILHGRHHHEENVTKRFLREARLASRLDHPYAAHIYAFGAEPGGVLWIAMELVRGTPLDHLLRDSGPLPIERLVTLFDRLCEVVHTAHEQGIVHRDLKPANVMVLSRAGRMLPKLLDLGIAKGTEGGEPARPLDAESLDGAENPSLTLDGMTLGSPRYMAPEQWLDAASADVRTDLYALGVLAYEVLAGTPPFDGPTVMAIARGHARRPVPPLPPGFPPALDAFFARAMAKAPGDRFATALEMAAALRQAAGMVAPPEALPQLDEDLRAALLSHAPQPLAEAAASLDAARNPHQAWAATAELVRVAVQLVALYALSGRSKIGSGDQLADPRVAATIRTLRARELTIAEWSDLARNLVRPLAARPEVFPLPELVMLFYPSRNPDAGVAPFSALNGLDAGQATVTADELRARLATTLRELGRVLSALRWLNEYYLVVTRADRLELWMGVRRPARLTIPNQTGLDEGQVALVNRDGHPTLHLAPLAQVGPPAPGMPDELFWLHGHGDKGALLVAWPRGFERQDVHVWEWLGAMLLGASTDASRVDSTERPPYRGLSAFSVDDAGLFFGRERHVETFVNRLRLHPFVVVVGPSGAGKSSFVAAGVLPRLRGYRAILLRPGPAPLVALSARVAQESGENASALRETLARDRDALGKVLRRIAEAEPVVLVVDQLEELLTNCRDPDERLKFSELVTRAARSVEEPVRVIATLRDDFLLHAEKLRGFSDVFARGVHILGAPGPDELLRIVIEPARQAGYDFDDSELPARMVDEVKDRPGALALLSFTAATLWSLRDRHFRKLTVGAYDSIGGVGGALAQHAEQTLTAMPQEEQRLVREAFRQAVNADETRATLERAELVQVLGGGAHAVAVIEKLIAARLLVSSDGPTGGEQIEIAHEALITAWPRLVGWRREDADGARLRDQLRAASRQWEDRGRPSGLLWRGDALAEYRQWRARYQGGLSEIDEAFATASVTEDARVARRRRMVFAFAFSLLSAGVIALLLLNSRVASQRSRAEASAHKEKAAAERLRRSLLAQLEDQGRRYVLDGDPLPGIAYLDAARELGGHGPAYDLAVAFAARSLSNQQRQFVHDDRVLGATFSPDGTRLVTAGVDKRARLWDPRTGVMIADLPHDGIVLRPAISGDSGAVLTASADGTARIWDARTGNLRASLRGHGGRLLAALFSPNADLVVTIAADSVVELWNAHTGRLVATLQSHPQPAPWRSHGTPAAFSADGMLVAVGDGSGTVRVWDVSTHRLVARNSDHAGQIEQVRFSRDRRRVLIASADATASVFDAATGKRAFSLPHRQAVHAAAFSSDDRWIATASGDRTAVIWDASTGRAVRTLSGHTAPVSAIAFRADDRQLVTASLDKTAVLWDVASGRREARLIGHNAMVESAEYDRTGAYLVTAGADHRAILWTTRADLPVVHLTGHDKIVHSAEFSADGTRVITASEDGTARVWDRATGRQLLELVHDGVAIIARFSPDDRLIATTGTDRSIHIWDAATGEALRTLSGHAARVSSLAWLPDGERLATASEDGTARVWRWRDGAPALVFRGHGGHEVASVAIAPRGDVAVTVGTDRTIQIWDVTTGEVRWLAASHDGLVNAEFDPTGTLLAGNTPKGFRIYRVGDGATIVNVVNQSNLATVGWSSDGEFLVTASVSGITQIWDARRGDPIATLSRDDQVPVFAASFAPDGRFVASASMDGTVTVWELPPRVDNVQALARCVPFRVRDFLLVQVEPDASCTSSHP